MTENGSTDDVQGEVPCEPELTDVITRLGELPPGALLTKEAVARIFNRDPVSIDRAIKRGELPPPVKLLGSARFTARSIIAHHERRMADAASDEIQVRRNCIQVDRTAFEK